MLWTKKFDMIVVKTKQSKYLLTRFTGEEWNGMVWNG